MQTILLCSYDPLLLKNLYGMLRQDGYEVDVADHAAHAVQMSFRKHYDVALLDADSVGFPAADAAAIIGSTSRCSPVLISSDAAVSYAAARIGKPLDLEEVKRVIADIGGRTAPERRSQGA